MEEGMKNRRFPPIYRFILETTQYMAVVIQWKTIRNSYAIYRIVPFLVTLNDP